MNVLNTVDKGRGTNNGKVLDIEWKKKLLAYIENELD
jgi:hypothetical protein